MICTHKAHIATQYLFYCGCNKSKLVTGVDQALRDCSIFRKVPRALNAFITLTETTKENLASNSFHSILVARAFIFDSSYQTKFVKSARWLDSEFLSRLGLIESNPGPEDSFEQLPQLKGCRVLHQNVNKIPRKLCRIKDLLLNFSSKTIVGFTESGLTQTQKDNSLNVSRYNFIRFDNAERVSLGILVYYTKDIKLVEHNTVSTAEFTFMHTHFQLGNDHLYFGCFYRLPDSSQNFFREFSDTLETLVHSNHLVAIIGDMNIDLSKSGQLQSRYMDILDELGLSQKIKTPTRILANSQTLIDHVLVSPAVKADHTINFDTLLSDHNMTGIRILNFGQKIPPPIKFHACKLHAQGTGLNFKTCNFENLRQELSIVEWGDVNNVPGLLPLTEKFSLFLEKIIMALKNNTSSYPCKCGKRLNARLNSKPWFTFELARERTACSDLHKFIMKRSIKGSLLQAYRTLRQRLIRKTEHARNAYYKQLVQNLTPNDRWKVINEIRGHGKNESEIVRLEYNQTITENQTDIANTLNRFFVSIGQSTFEEVSQDARQNRIRSHNFPRNSPRDTFRFTLPCEETVMKAILKLKENKPPGPSAIPIAVIKEIAAQILTPLTNVFKSCIVRSDIPKEFKRAYVTPILKKGAPENPTNYRPISVTSAFAKIFEIILKWEIEKHLVRYQVLSTTQYGFREAHSSIHAMIDGIDDALGHLNSEKDKFASFLYLDLSKAFDCVDHEILCRALDSVGFDHNSRTLIRSLLSNRTQAVKLKNVTSGELPISIGVAQGSILGPLIFTIFVNDCNRILSNFHTKIVQYADDVCIITKADTTIEILARTEKNLEKAHTFFASLGLKLNVAKTQFIPMTNAVNKRELLRNMTLFEHDDSRKVKATSTGVNLGLTVDDTLTFSNHKEIILGRLKAVLQSIRCIRNKISESTAKMLYESLFLGIHDYASCVYDTNGYGTLAINEKIEGLHRKTLRCIYKDKLKTTKIVRNGLTEYRLPENQRVYQVAGVAPLEKRRKRYVAMMTHDIINGRAPIGVSRLVTVSDTLGPRSREQAAVRIPRPLRTNMLKHSFAYRSAELWMTLDPDLRKIALKSTFLSNFDNWVAQSQVSLLNPNTL
jgi:hypothetical protein